MNIDHYFEIGKLHNICEDYSYSRLCPKGDYGIVVVADGCSASSKTVPVDFGARLLVHSLIKSLSSVIINRCPYLIDIDYLTVTPPFYFENDDNRSIFYHTCKSVCSQNTKESCCLHDFSPQVLDCTLVFCLSNGVDRHHISCVGDGMIVVKKQNQFGEEETIVYEITYESGAPFYMSYLLEPDRLNRYRDEFGKFNKTVTKYVFDKDCTVLKSEAKNIIKNEDIFSLSIHSNAVTSISVCSDGLLTYHVGPNSIDKKETFKNFFAYKNYQGEFVKRRMLSFKRQCEKDKIEHDDDISIATMHIK